MPKIVVETEGEIQAAALFGVVPVCTDVTSGEADQCAGVVVNAIINWRDL